MTAAAPRPVDAAAVTTGDLIWFLGKAHLVSEIETLRTACAADHAGCPGEEIRIAVEAATGWRFALWPDATVEILG